MKKYFEPIRNCALFDDIETDNLSSMLGCLGGKIQSFAKGETVVAEGDPAVNIGVVLSGAVQIVRTDYYGNRSILTSVGVSEIFGESFACAGVPAMPVNIIATEDTEALMMDCQRVTQFCCNACGFHSRMVYNLMKMVATKNIIFNQKLEITSKRTTRDKLMTYLMMQAKQKNSSSFVIPYDRQELADFLDVDRSGLSAEISKLRKEGVIECTKNNFRLL